MTLIIFGAAFIIIFSVLAITKPFLAFQLLVIFSLTEMLSGISLIPGISLMVAVGMVFVGIWLIRSSMYKIQLKSFAGGGLLVIFLLIIILSLLSNISEMVTYRPIISYIQQILLVIIIVNFVTSHKQIQKMCYTIIAASSLIAVVIILGYFNLLPTGVFGRVETYIQAGQLPTTRIIRLGGFFSDPNFTSSQLIVSVPFILELWKVSSKKRKTLLFIAGVIIMFSFFLTYSIGGLFGLLAYLVYKITLIDSNRKMVKIAKGLIWVVFGITFIILVIPQHFQLRIMENVELLTGFLTTRDPTYLLGFGSTRGYAWDAAIRAIIKSPILGHGPGNAQYVLPQYSLNPRGMYVDRIAAHNMVLGVGADLGLLGLVIFTLINFQAIRNVSSKNNLFDTADYKKKYYQKAILGALIICLALGMSISLHLIKLPWIIIGTSYAFNTLTKKVPADSKHNLSFIENKI